MIGKCKYTYHNGVSYNMVWRRGGCVTKIKTAIWKWPQGLEIVTKVSVVNKVLIGPLYKSCNQICENWNATLYNLWPHCAYIIRPSFQATLSLFSQSHKTNIVISTTYSWDLIRLKEILHMLPSRYTLIVLDNIS